MEQIGRAEVVAFVDVEWEQSEYLSIRLAFIQRCRPDPVARIIPQRAQGCVTGAISFTSDDDDDEDGCDDSVL